jgi:hypothetical protein
MSEILVPTLGPGGVLVVYKSSSVPSMKFMTSNGMMHVCVCGDATRNEGVGPGGGYEMINEALTPYTGHCTKCGAKRDTVRSITCYVRAKYGVNHPMKHHTWGLNVAPSVSPTTRSRTHHGAICGKMVYLMVYPPWYQL